MKKNWMPLLVLSLLSSQLLFTSCGGATESGENNADVSDTTVDQPTIGVELDTTGSTYVDTTGATTSSDTTGTTTGTTTGL
ncbi:hypothetical protein ACFSKU_15985 [Pontibacter silvestris]|uniref:Uncharacterized protein n=1 Tax=Pontibacter silvestris TaxID=2305183 RepID=A0ABW4X2A0_9BACT|nr:hypothetical protein [Pontibacter silvestris]MCC9135970.1 hypothetical protein [Pontibacter silvestris]